MQFSRSAILLLIFSLLCGTFSTYSYAGRVYVTDGAGIYNGGDASGGAFTINQDQGVNGVMGGTGGSATSFLTFCIEFNEHIGFNKYYYTKIDTVAVEGGVGGPSPDPLSSATALLYSTFRAGGLINGISINTPALVSSLQYAIWRLEDEIAQDSGGNWATISPGIDQAYVPVAKAMVQWAQTNANGSLYNVRVLQLWNNSQMTDNAQDQLTIVVPTPSASLAGVGLLGACVIGASVRRRRLACVF